MKLQFELKQKLNISQKIIQSSEILQMSSRELEDYIGELAMENPIIDIDNIGGVERDVDVTRKLEWLNKMNENINVNVRWDNDDNNEKDIWDYIGDGKEEDLYQYLNSQILMNNYSLVEENVIHYLLMSLDSKGYLLEDINDIALKFGVEAGMVNRLLCMVQELEPAGVGARNLRECLLLQLERNHSHNTLVRDIVFDYLELLAKNQLSVIADKLKVTISEVVENVKIIKTLNPKPGTCFSSRDNLYYIEPDITVVKLKGHYEILINEYKYPRVSINSYYLNILKSDCSSETKNYINTKVGQADWVVNCINQRNSTLLSITKMIIDYQEDFFLRRGMLKPMRLIELSVQLGIHESTVSRAVRGKFLQCTWGIYPLNYFFVKAFEMKQQNEEIKMTPEYIKEKMTHLIEVENKKKPLSDQKISEMLKSNGIDISRRTVAKYRSNMGVRDASGRKVFV